MSIRSIEAYPRWVVISPYLVVVAFLLSLTAFSIDMLSATRAYVGGEGLWSKGQKDAVRHLVRYTHSGSEVDFQNYLDALAVPLGDRQARLELERPTPDLRLVREGLLRGGNHADDIDSMVRLYQRFRNVDFMAQAIDTWAEADSQLVELRTLAQQIRSRMRTGDTGSPELRAQLDAIEPLNDKLTGLSQRFSATLGTAARLAQGLMLWGTVLIGVMLGLLGFSLTSYLLRREARTARALRESNERWTLATEAAGIGVFDWDLGRDKVSIDARAAALIGLPDNDGELDGSELSSERVHADDAARLLRALRNAIDSPAPLHMRFRVGRANDNQRHLQIDARTRARGEVTRLIGIISDVSDDVQAEQLKLDRDGAERANRAKSELLSRVSHELRTPLNAVLGFAQLLQTDPVEPLTTTQHQRIQHVLDSGQHLLELVNDVLDLSRLERDTLHLDITELPLAPLLQASVEQVAPLARGAQVAMACELAPGTEALHVRADAQRLRQAVAHLLTNAIKYNRPGGQVALGLRCEDSQAVLEVRDTGIGMNPEQLARLFQPFDRLGAERSKVTGSGLGLVITQQLVQRMGGTLTLQSEPGQGTCAALRVPLADPQGNQATQVPREVASTGPMPLVARHASQVGGGRLGDAEWARRPEPRSEPVDSSHLKGFSMFG